MSLRGELFRAQCPRNGNKRHRPKQSKCEIASLTLAMTKRELDCFTEYIDRRGFQTPHPVAGQACPEFNEGNVPPAGSANVFAMTKRELDCFTEYIDRRGFQTPHPVAGQACPKFNEGNVPPAGSANVFAMTKRELDCFTEYIDRRGFQTPHPVAPRMCSQ